MFQQIKRYKNYKSIVVVYGGRDFNYRDVVFRKLDKLHRKYNFDFVVAGGATGADNLAIEWAKDRGIDFKEEPADWSNLSVEPCLVKTNSSGKKYNALAGLARNQSMLDKYKPHYAVEFPGGTGTKDMNHRVGLKMAFGLLDKRITIYRKKK